MGRDPSQSEIVLTEGRISAAHARLKWEDNRLWVWDEASVNGTFLGGMRIPAHTWTEVTAGAKLSFGPLEFDVAWGQP